MPTTWELCCGKEDDQMEDQERQEPADKKPNYLELPDVTGYIRQIILSPSTILKITIFLLSLICFLMILAESIGTSEVVSTRRTTSQYVHANGSNATALTDVTVNVLIENLCSGKNADNRANAQRICFVGMAAGLGSSFVSIVLIQLDLLIPCIGYLQWKRLANAGLVIFSAMLAVFWLIASSLLANLFRDACEIGVSDNRCETSEDDFIAVPVVGFANMVLWIIVGLISLVWLIKTRHDDR